MRLVWAYIGHVLKATAAEPAWGGLVSEGVVRVKNTLYDPIQPSKNLETNNMRALALRCQLAPDRGTYTVLIPLQKSEGKNERVGQNEVDQRREHIVNVSKVPRMMSCGQGGAKPLASESRLRRARCAML